VLWVGLVAPARTPDEIVRRLNAAVTQSQALPDVRAVYSKRGAIQSTSTPEEMRAFLEKEIKKWAEVVKRSGARID
jgi:tripartite-type tricarboxylate transporter receptor subunit TctC